MPCALVSFDIENEINEYKVNMFLKKVQIDKNGAFMMEYLFSEKENADHESIKAKAIE